MIFFTVFIAILAILGFIMPTIIGRGDVNDRYVKERRSITNKLRLIIPLALILLLALILTFSSMHIIDQTEVGVIRTFGEITGSLSSGMNFVNPLTDSVTIYDTKVRSAVLVFDSYTKDAQPINVIVEVQYDISADKAMTVATSYGTYEVLEAKLSNVIEERIKVVLSRKSAMTLMDTRANLSGEAYDEVGGLSDTFPIHFTSVIVKDVAFSDAFEASVEAKMTAEQTALKAEQEKKTAEIKAEQEKAVLITAAEAKLESAELNKQAAIIDAEAKAQALLIASKAESDALIQKTAALENLPDEYFTKAYFEKWNGVLPQIITEGAELLINPSLPATK